MLPLRKPSLAFSGCRDVTDGRDATGGRDVTGVEIARSQGDD